jgi:hypothetical protein
MGKERKMPRNPKNDNKRSETGKTNPLKASLEGSNPHKRITVSTAPGGHTTLPETSFKGAGFSSGVGISSISIPPHPGIESLQAMQKQTEMGDLNANAPVNPDAGVSMHEQIALLAYSYWKARGNAEGTPEEDWYKAEREVLARMTDPRPVKEIEESLR